MEASDKPPISPLPSMGDILFLLILYLIFVFLPDFMYADGSTGWHLVTGQYILDNGRIPRTDIISYTFPDKPWVAYEWLFDVVVAALDRIGGLPLVAVAVASSIALLFMLVYESCRKVGCHFLLAAFLTVIGTLVSAIHWLVRPHIVTFWALFIFSRTLERFYRGELTLKKLIVFLGITMVIWANCHPAFIIGFVMVGIYLVSTILIALATAPGDVRTKALSQARSFGLVLLVLGGASLINPYGLQLHEYIFHYLTQGQVLSQTDEYKSPTFHGALQPSLLEFLFFCLAVALVTTRKKPSLPQLLTVLAFAHLALSSLRSFPFFVVVALPFIAELLANSRLFELISRFGSPASWVTALGKQFDRIGKVFDEVEFSCRMHILPVVAVVVLALSCLNGARAFGVQLVRSHFPADSKPTTTLEYLSSHRLFDRKGLNMDNWGGYILYKTGNRVFIDDRADFYGEEFYLQYGDVSMMRPGWEKILDRYGIEWVLFPRDSALAITLKDHSGWKLAAQDPAAYLLVRDRSRPLSATTKTAGDD